MGDLGLSSTFGVGAMQQSVRQRILDQLQRQAQAHQMSVEDQRLDLERQRLAADAADRSLLRNQQATAFNETIGEKAGANLGAGQTVLTPSQAAPILNAPSMRGLITPDQTLPSTQIVSGMLAPTTEITPETQIAGTQPLVTQKAPTLTGQLRFMGTPKANQDEAARVRLSQLTRAQPAGSPERLALEYEEATGKNAPAAMFPSKAQTRVIAVPGPNGGKVEKSFTDAELAAGVPGYVAPQSSTAGWSTTTLKINGVDTPVRVHASTGQVLPLTAGEQDVLAPKTGAVEENRATSAKTVNQVGDAIIQQVQANADKLGPILSRYNSVADFYGAPPPEFAKLAGEIESFSLANMGVHGMRSANGAEAIRETIGLGRHTPESLIAILQGLMGFSTKYLENVRGTGEAPKAPPQGPTEPPARPRIRYDMNGKRIP